MKLKNIFGIALSALLFTACSEDDPIGSFDNLTVDKTFALISTDGGDVKVTVNAGSEWKLEDLYSVTATIDGKKETLKYPLPVTLNKAKTAGEYTWLTVDKTSGAAGQTVLTFNAPKTEGGREAEVCINMGGMKQFIKVRQGSLVASSATCAEIIAAPDGKNFRLTAKITKWANNAEKYGNMWVSDGTGDVQIYGMADKDGKLQNSPIASWGLEIGDEITVEGPKSTYGTTIELVDVTVINVTKSLLKVVTPNADLGIDGDVIEVKTAYKGSGAYYTIADDAKSWITYESVTYKGGTKTIFEQNPADTAIYKFTVAANNQDKRSGTITFSSASGKNVSQIVYTVNQKGIAFPPSGKGTEEDPFNVTAAINACAAGMTGAYVKGIISKAPESVNTKYGSCTYYISADGKETSDQLQVYSGLFLQKEKFTSADQVKVGDEVIVVGELKLYNGTPEINQNNWIYSLNGNKGGALPTSLEIDFTAGQGDWTIKDVALDEGVTFVWKVDNTYGMKATAYVSGASHPTDSWLISPAVKLDNEATLTFDQALNKGTKDAVKVLMSTTYAGGAINPTEWTELTLDQWPAGNNWNYLTSTAKVPAAAKVYIAFRYNSTASNAPTWEIKTLSLK